MKRLPGVALHGVRAQVDQLFQNYCCFILSTLPVGWMLGSVNEVSVWWLILWKGKVAYVYVKLCIMTVI